MDQAEQNTPLRGFARLTPAERSDIARRGGIAAQRSGKAHRFSRKEAQAAGRKGGAARASTSNEA